MKKTGKFIELGNTLRKITYLLTDVTNPKDELANAARNICKLLYYTQSNPLNQPQAPLLNPDHPAPEFDSLEDVREHIINKRILLVPRIFVPSEQGAFIVFIINGFHLSENKQFKVNQLVFDVICHHDNWLLDDNLRPFVLMQQIDTIFNNRKLSIGQVEFKDANAVVLTAQHLGYQLVYRDVSFN